MPVQLNPLSTFLFIFEHGFRYNLNQTAVLRSRRRLEQERLKTALLLTVARQPVLHSRVQLETAPDRFRCIWERLARTAPLPLSWKRLPESDPAFESRLQDLEFRQHNHPLNCAEGAPFHLFVHDCGDWGTHLQLVLSHVAGDGKSLLLFFRELFEHYLEEPGADSDVAPLPHLPGVSGNPFIGTRLERAIRLENGRRNRQGLPCFGDQRDWPIVLANQARRGFGAEATDVLRPFPYSEYALTKRHDQYSDIGRFHYRLSGADLTAMKTAARQHRIAVSDLITMAFILAQQEMAREAGEPLLPVLISIPLDLRLYAKGADVRHTLGNLLGNIHLRINPGPDRKANLPAAFKDLTKQKFDGLRRWGKAAGELFADEPVEYNLSYQCMESLLLSMTVDKRLTTVSHLGNLSSVLPAELQQRMGVEYVDLGSVSVTTPAIQTLEHDDYLSITYCWLHGMSREREIARFAERFMTRLERLATELIGISIDGNK